MLLRISALQRERCAPPAGARRPRQGPPDPDAHASELSGHGRAHHALSDALLGEDRGRQAARPAARPALDGRPERRLFMPVPDHAAGGRPAPFARDGDRAVLAYNPWLTEKALPEAE